MGHDTIHRQETLLNHIDRNGVTAGSQVGAAIARLTETSRYGETIRKATESDGLVAGVFPCARLPRFFTLRAPVYVIPISIERSG